MDQAVNGIRVRKNALFRCLASTAVAVLSLLFLCAPPVAASTSAAPALPTPKDLTAHLDLECFKTNPYQPPATQLTLRHLNPVLANLPTETVTLGPREQLCVPVSKNTQVPPSPAIDFIKYIDLSCYRISGATAQTGLVLSHLNPLLQSLPRTQITMNTPQQLCVPVMKNNAVPPPEILRLVRHIDLKCYSITPNTAMNRQLSLRQLNPVLTPVIPTHGVTVTYARQLCVPVLKAGDNPPAEVLNIVRWIDLEKFDVVVSSALPTVSLGLRHLNPVLANLPGEQATLAGASQLALPVAKNGNFPPG